MTEPTCLYRAYDAQGHLLYVGITDDTANRFYMHELKSPWYPSMANINERWYPDRTAALDAERIAIQGEHPQWNLAHAFPPIQSPESFCGRLAAAVRDVMAENGITTQQLQTTTGIARKRLNQALCNERPFKVAELDRIAKALHTEPSSLSLLAEAAA